MAGQLWCRLPTVGCWAVVSGYLPTLPILPTLPPSPHPPSLVQRMGIASVAPLCNTPPGEGYDCEYGLAKLFGEHTHGPVTSGIPVVGKDGWVT